MAAISCFLFSLENFCHKLRHYLLWELKKAKEDLEHTLPPFTFLAQMVIKYPTDYTTLKKKLLREQTNVVVPGIAGYNDIKVHLLGQEPQIFFTCAITSIQSFNTSQESIFFIIYFPRTT